MFVEEEKISTEVQATIEVAPNKPTENKTATSKRPDNRRPGGRENRRFEKPKSEFEEKLVNVSRVTTVVKGGRRFSFSVVVVIGNKKGKVGYGHGKANEVPDAIKKAVKDAQRNLINVPIINGTAPHETQAKFVSSNVLVKPAPKGKGIIASGSVRAVVELAGFKDVVTKSLGSSNKTNVVKATLKALSQLATVEDIAKLRDIDVKALV